MKSLPFKKNYFPFVEKEVTVEEIEYNEAQSLDYSFEAKQELPETINLNYKGDLNKQSKIDAEYSKVRSLFSKNFNIAYDGLSNDKQARDEKMMDAAIKEMFKNLRQIDEMKLQREKNWNTAVQEIKDKFSSKQEWLKWLNIETRQAALKEKVKSQVIMELDKIEIPEIDSEESSDAEPDHQSNKFQNLI